MASSPYLLHSSTKSIIPFKGASVFTIGRSGDCNLDIAAIYISRRQCRIENLDDVGWVIFDESRFKTTKLNEELVGSEYKVLKDGDRISFSPYCSSHEYVFRFDSNQNSIAKKRKMEEALTQLETVNKFPKVSEATQNEQIPVVKCEISNHSTLALPTTPIKTNFDELIPVVKCEISNLSTLALPTTPIKTNFDELQQLREHNVCLAAELKDSKYHAESSSLAVTLLETENKSLIGRVEEVEKSNRQLKETLAALQSDAKNFSSRQTTLEEMLLQLRMTVEKMSKEKSELTEALTDAESEIESLLTERCCKILKFGSDKRDHQGNNVDTLMEVELSLMKEDLKELTRKNSDLSLNLESLQVEKTCLSNQVNEIIDGELLCSICSDLIYQAVTLQCKHTFCKCCVEEWYKKKKECPVCRTKVKTQISSLVIDNIIDKLVNTIGGEIKDRRNELIAERQAAASAPKPRQNKRKRTNNLPEMFDIFGVAPSAMVEEIFDMIDLTGIADAPIHHPIPPIREVYQQQVYQPYQRRQRRRR